MVVQAPSQPASYSAQAQDRPSRELLRSRFREFFQTEQSAESHPRVEAGRLEGTPPGDAMLAVAEHAREVLRDLPGLAKTRGLPVSGVGMAVGRLFSIGRRAVADKLIDVERSYRGTLLGVRHGIDLVTLIGAVARMQGDPELENYCARWLVKRRALLETLAEHTQWFATHPEKALSKP